MVENATGFTVHNKHCKKFVFTAAGGRIISPLMGPKLLLELRKVDTAIYLSQL